MPRMWADKTIDELHEEWHRLRAKLERAIDDKDYYAAEHAEAAKDAIEIEIGRRRKPLVVSEVP